MAKGLRASVTKRNKTKLRARVFEAVENARTERLSAKLLELAQQPKAGSVTTANTDMEIDASKKTDEQAAVEEPAQEQAEDMDVDDAVRGSSSSSKKSKKSGKVQKSRHRRARNDNVFRNVGQKFKSKDRIGRSLKR